MELMDNSLTNFLESSQDPVPYHIQVNFCHDINLAISYLHSNGIIHRDLSSNNVLLRGNVITKVTDFGMAKLVDTNLQATHNISLTMVPGTDAYMPPEAVKEQPVYSAKIDCFAIGVLIIQILSRQWPKPGDRLKSVHTTDPQFPGGIVSVLTSEIERRQNHISLVDPNHHLLPIALHCLKDSDVERPTAQELCHTVAALKETPQYTESVRSAQERRLEPDNTTEREEQIRELQQQIQQKDDIIREKDDVIQEKDDAIQQRGRQIQGLQQIIGSQNNHLKQKDVIIQEKAEAIQQRARQIQGLQQIIGSQNNHLEEKDGIIQEKEQTISTLQQESQQLRESIRDKDRELKRLTRQLQTSEQVTAQFQSPIIHELEKQQPKAESPTEVLAKQQPSLKDPPWTHHSETRVIKERLQLKWRKENNAPCKMARPLNTVVEGDTVYLRPVGTKKVYAYNLADKMWNQLPDCLTGTCSLVVVKNLLTTIGGKSDYEGKVTDQLFSLKKTWDEVFPPMPTKRSSSIAVCTGQALIVAGGWDQHTRLLRTVEVMDVSTEQWTILLLIYLDHSLRPQQQSVEMLSTC